MLLNPSLENSNCPVGSLSSIFGFQASWHFPSPLHLQQQFSDVFPVKGLSAFVPYCSYYYRRPFSDSLTILANYLAWWHHHCIYCINYSFEVYSHPSVGRSMWFATSIFNLASLGQMSWWQTTLTFPPWGVNLVNTLQSYGLHTYIYIAYIYIAYTV